MFSKRTQLCIDVLVTVGSAPQGVLVNTQALAEKMSISISHIESILRLLREGGFVRSVRGPGGGYFMTRHPDQISVWAVVSAVGGLEELGKPSSTSTHPTDALENALYQVIKGFLSGKTLGEFVRADPTWNVRPEPVRFGFGLGPKPASLMPVAPNSVFELSSFLHGVAA
jgi:Rrf2 family iron-sulfur cluster assembly transcriptional regulator